MSQVSPWTRHGLSHGCECGHGVVVGVSLSFASLEKKKKNLSRLRRSPTSDNSTPWSGTRPVRTVAPPDPATQTSSAMAVSHYNPMIR
jgi:hypothetical protein